jgi:hypothetical protein
MHIDGSGTDRAVAVPDLNKELLATENAVLIAEQEE